jgi:hypothetical protein
MMRRGSGREVLPKLDAHLLSKIAAAILRCAWLSAIGFWRSFEPTYASKGYAQRAGSGGVAK